MKKTLKAGTFVLSFLLVTGILSQTNVYAKGNSGKVQGNSKIHTAETHEKATDSTEKSIPYGLAKKTLPPVIKQGGILIPVNAVTKSLGANLVWDSQNQVVTVTKESTTIVIDLINKTATVNGTSVALPQNIVTEGTNATTETQNVTTEGTDITTETQNVTTEKTNATLGTETISNNGTLVLFNFIAQNLGVNLDENQIQQINNEALASDSSQTLNPETVITDNTSNANTDVQASTDLQN